MQIIMSHFLNKCNPHQYYEKFYSHSERPTTEMSAFESLSCGHKFKEFDQHF